MEASIVQLGERYWDDFPVGFTIRTRGLTVTETHIVMWAAVAGDWLPIHMDREFTKNTVFGEPIAHGPLTLSLALGLVTQTNVYGDAIIAWLGLDEVRLPAPVRIGDTIHVVGVVEEQAETSKPERGRVRIAFQVLNQRDEVVLTYLTSFLMHRKPA
jgi:itaconyl-CoA hydratase